ncbi:MAG TPA: HEAT repeat domain-containing protein [Planctomycetota bacterium]|nr:HEAT repeat domain-containing protein [Planctomycetota bacterium]
MRALVTVGLILASCPSAFAVQDSFTTESRFHRVYLRNGNFIDGQIIKDTPKEVVLKLALGEMVIRKDQIDRVELVRMRSLRGEPQGLSAIEAPRTSPKAPQAPKGPPTQSPPNAVPSEIPHLVQEEIDGLILKWRGSPEKNSQTAQEDLARSLEVIGAEGVPYLGWLLEQRPETLPLRAISTALGRLGGAKAVTPLGRILQSKDPEARLSAALGLSLIETVEVEPYLLAALDDESAEVWQAASQSLVDRIRKNREDRITRAIISRLPKAHVKAPFAITLGRVGSPEAHQELLLLLRDDDENDQKAALQGLAQMHDPEDGEAVQACLQRSGLPVQKEICLLLGKLKFRPAIPDLIERLGQEDSGLRANAHWALRAITGQSLGPQASLWKAWWEATGKFDTKK